MKIFEYRDAIDVIDQKLLELLNERARLALKIGFEKFENRLSVKSTDREQSIFDALYQANNGPLQEQHIREIFTAIFSASRKLQHLYQSYEDV